MNEGIRIHAMRKKSLVPLMYLFPFSDFKWRTTETNSFFYQFYKEFSLKTEGNMGPQVYEPSTFSLQPYVASVLASFSCSIHSDCKHSMGVIWLSFCTTPLAKQSEPISSSLHEVLTQQYHHIGFPGCWQWATPGTSQKSRNYGSNNNNNNTTRHP